MSQNACVIAQAFCNEKKSLLITLRALFHGRDYLSGYAALIFSTAPGAAFSTAAAAIS